MNLLRCSLSIFALLRSAGAYSTGAGGCPKGTDSVDDTHLDPTRTQTTGGLDVGQLQVTVNRVPLDPATSFDIPVGTSVTLAVESVAADGFFTGVLIRLESPLESDLSTALTPDSNLKQVADTVCVPPAVGITHIDSSRKRNVSSTLFIDIPLQGLNLDVTVVGVNNSTLSSHFYTGFTLNAVNTTPSPSGPSTIPSDVPSVRPTSIPSEILSTCPVEHTSAIECSNGTIRIAGSSTLLPLVKRWQCMFKQICPHVNVTVSGGGSRLGARQVCNQFLNETEQAVDIGDMSDPFFDESSSDPYRQQEVFPSTNGYLYQCINSSRSVIQVIVAYDGLTIATGGGAKIADKSAYKCIQSLPGQGLTIDQLRWMYSNWSESMLIQSGWDPKSVNRSDGNDTRRTWFELGGNVTYCSDEEIMISGSDPSSGTYDFFRRIVFQGNANETFAENRSGGYYNNDDDDRIVDYLVDHPFAIGYFGFSYAEGNKENISEIRIYSAQHKLYVNPSTEVIMRKDYPLTRPLFMNVWNDSENLDHVRPWIKYVLETGVSKDEGVNVSSAEKLVMLTRVGAPGGISSQDVDCGPSAGNLTIEVDSAIFPILDTWANIFNVLCSKVHFSVAGSGESSNLSQICSGGHIDIFGDESDKEANSILSTFDGWQYTCTNSNFSFVKVDVAIDAVTVATNSKGTAFDCMTKIQGLTLDQLRWIYSNYNEAELEATGWNSSALPNSDGNSSTHLWSELSSKCNPSEIILSGPSGLSETSKFMSEILFRGPGESFELTRPDRFIESSFDDLPRFLSSTDSGISFGSISTFSDSPMVFMVPIFNDKIIDFIGPTVANIEVGDYVPFSRRLTLSLGGDNANYDSLRSFIDFGLSNDGALLIKKRGYIPIPIWERKVMKTRAGSPSGIRLSEIGASSRGCVPSNATISIAGSSTVFPISRIWAEIYKLGCPLTINVQGGGSEEGAKRVCDCNAPVDVGGISREFRNSEALDATNATLTAGYRSFVCTQGDKTREVIQIKVAGDGITLATKKGGVADLCIQKLGFLTLEQLRWIFTNLSDDELELASSKWYKNSVKFSDGNSSTHLWSELHENCSRNEILIAGADEKSGTYDYFKEVVFKVPTETFATNRPNSYFGSEDDETLIAHLNRHSESIAYVGYFYFLEHQDILSAVPILNPDGQPVLPDESSIADGSYPFSRPLYMNLRKSRDSLENTLRLAMFGLSEIGSTLVTDVGYVPVLAEMREAFIYALNGTLDSLASITPSSSESSCKGLETTPTTNDRWEAWVVSVISFVVLASLAVFWVYGKNMVADEEIPVVENEEGEEASPDPPFDRTRVAESTNVRRAGEEAAALSGSDAMNAPVISTGDTAVNNRDEDSTLNEFLQMLQHARANHSV